MPLTIVGDSTCDICADEYGRAGDPNTEGLVPAVLPCGHVLCRSCISNLALHGPQPYSFFAPQHLVTAQCPFCRTRFNVINDVRTLVCDVAAKPSPKPATPELEPHNGDGSGLPSPSSRPRSRLDRPEEEYGPVDMMDHDPRAVEVERHMAKAARLVRRLRAACEAELAAGEEGTRDGHGHEALRKARKFLVRREEQGEVVAEQYPGLSTSARLLEVVLEQRTRHAEAFKLKDASWTEYVTALNATWNQHTADLIEQNASLRHQLAERLLAAAPAMPRLMSPPTDREREREGLRTFSTLPNYDHNPMPEPAKLVEWPKSRGRASNHGVASQRPPLPPAVTGPVQQQSDPSRPIPSARQNSRGHMYAEGSSSTMVNDIARSQPTYSDFPERSASSGADPEVLRRRLEDVSQTRQSASSSNTQREREAVRRSMSAQYTMPPPQASMSLPVPDRSAAPAGRRSFTTDSAASGSVFTPTPAMGSGPHPTTPSPHPMPGLATPAEASAILPAAPDAEFVQSNERERERERERRSVRTNANLSRSMSHTMAGAYRGAPVGTAGPNAYPTYLHHTHHPGGVPIANTHGRTGGGLWAPMDSDTEGGARRRVMRGY